MGDSLGHAQVSADDQDLEGLEVFCDRDRSNEC
jgi:hypothetical protein